MQRTILLAAAALTLTAASAHAAPAPALTVQTRVVYGDLNLSTQAGAKTMLARIKSAAEAGCGGTPFAVEHTLKAFEAFNACRDEAVRGAVASLRAPMVTALLRGQSGRATSDYAAAR